MTNVGNATSNSDALNRQTGDSRYYMNTTTLNNITLANSDLSVNSHKITDIANGTNPNDAVAFG